MLGFGIFVRGLYTSIATNVAPLAAITGFHLVELKMVSEAAARAANMNVTAVWPCR